jgi:hypothetical protein
VFQDANKHLSDAWRRTAQSWWAVVAIHVTYVVLGICFLVPLTGLLGRALLALSGHTLVADQVRITECCSRKVSPRMRIAQQSVSHLTTRRKRASDTERQIFGTLRISRQSA